MTEYTPSASTGAKGAVRDGRHRRSDRSRAQIIEAMFALVGEGYVTPTAEQVAERAGISLRTMFRHFADMETLYGGMADRAELEYADWLEPFTAETWQARLAQMIDRRLSTYERLMPYKHAVDAHRHASPTIQRNHTARLALMRQRLEAILPPAIKGEATQLETIDLMMSFEAWQRLRVDQTLSTDAARAVVERTINRAVAGVQA